MFDYRENKQCLLTYMASFKASLSKLESSTLVSTASDDGWPMLTSVVLGVTASSLALLTFSLDVGVFSPAFSDLSIPGREPNRINVTINNEH